MIDESSSILKQFLSLRWGLYLELSDDQLDALTIELPRLI